MNRVSLILRQKIVGIIFILVAIFGGIFVFWYINNLKSAATEDESIIIFIATRDIWQGEGIISEMFEKQKISGNIFSERFITDQEQISGRIVLSDIIKGEIISNDKLEGLGTDSSINLSFSAYIPEGLRAISIPVKYYGDYNLINIGDRIDIISTYYKTGDDILHSEIILTGKEIVLIGNVPDSKKYEGMPGEEDLLFDSLFDQNIENYELGRMLIITFYLEPYEVENIFLALDRGLLNLSILPKLNSRSF